MDIYCAYHVYITAQPMHAMALTTALQGVPETLNNDSVGTRSWRLGATT